MEATRMNKVLRTPAGARLAMRPSVTRKVGGRVASSRANARRANAKVRHISKIKAASHSGSRNCLTFKKPHTIITITIGRIIGNASTISME